MAQNPCYFTTKELGTLHRRFGHPSIERLHSLLESAGHDTERTAIEQLNKFCEHCQKHGKSPGRFKFNLPDENLQFNHTITVDLMYLDIGGARDVPVLHIIDSATRYNGARFLKDVSAKCVWENLRLCWIDCYLGASDLIIHDAGLNFDSKEFRSNAASMAIRTKCAPVEAHWSIGIVEKAHTPLRRAFEIILAELGADAPPKEACLQMAVKAVNDTSGSDGIVPTLLVYGAYPRLSDTDAPTATMQQRAEAIKKAMKDISAFRSKDAVSRALNTRNGPDTTATHDLVIGAEVLVWREKAKGNRGGWTGPWKLTAIEGETCIVKLPAGNTNFRITVCKPFRTAEAQEYVSPYGPPLSTPSALSTPTALSPLAERTSRPRIKTKKAQQNDDDAARKPPRKSARRVHFAEDEDEHENVRVRKAVNDADVAFSLSEDDVYIPEKQQSLSLDEDKDLNEDDDLENVWLMTDASDAPTPNFTDSRQQELNGLLENEVFKLVKRSDLPPGVRLFRPRFVDEVKNRGQETAFEKSRLVIQAYNDAGKVEVLTQSPTIQRASQRLILAIMPTFSKILQLYLRDISQAYVQSRSTLNRTFYAQPPKEMKLDLGDWILKVLKPLYGIPEAGNHWFGTYHGHHTKELGMEVSTYDPCLLFCGEMGPDFALLGLQTDDTLFGAGEKFAQKEQNELQKAHFLAKEREQLRSAIQSSSMVETSHSTKIAQSLSKRSLTARTCSRSARRMST